MELINRREAREQGLKRYFMGDPCSNGHVAERYVRDKACVICSQERYNHWRTINPERMRELERRRRQTRFENPEKKRERNRRYRTENPDKYREYQRRYRKRHPRKISDIVRQHCTVGLEKRRKKRREEAQRHYTSNREKVLEYQRRYRAANRERFLELSIKWRVKRANALIAVRKLGLPLKLAPADNKNHTKLQTRAIRIVRELERLAAEQSKLSIQPKE